MPQYTVLIAPVRITNCPTIEFGHAYYFRVLRSKDQVDWCTPAARCTVPGTLDLSYSRVRDNRGAIRPAFVVPFRVSFESEIHKRTVTIQLEERVQEVDAAVAGSDYSIRVIATAQFDL